MTLQPSDESSHEQDPRGHGEPPAPADAPRAITPRVRWKAWGERHVRLWWMLGLVLLAVAGYYTVTRWYDWSVEKRLIVSGESVEAEVLTTEQGGEYIKNKPIPKGSGMDFRYTFRGETYRLHGFMEGREGLIMTGQKIPIRIDPGHPTRWTARTKPALLWMELMIPILLVPFIILLLLVAWWQRGQVLRVYRDGEAVLAEVVGVGHSAAAPFSKMVRCAVHVGAEARIVKAILPPRRVPAVGQLLWLIAPAKSPQKGIPAALFE